MTAGYPARASSRRKSTRSSLGLPLRMLGSLSDPYPTYRRLRAEPTPVRWAPDVYLLLRADHVDAALRSDAVSSRITHWHRYPSATTGAPGPLAFADTMVMAVDGAIHRSTRRPLARSVAAHAREPSLPADLSERAAALLADCLALGRFDLVDDFAEPFASAVICDLFQIAGPDATALLRASADVSSILEIPGTTIPRILASARAYEVMRRILERHIVDTARAGPGSLFHELVEWCHQARLDDDAVVANLVFLFAAGFETVTSAIALAVRVLQAHPEQLEVLAAGGCSPRAAAEELLRYDGPVQMIWRTARDDVDIGGTRVGAGALLVLVLGAANRDPNRYEKPDELNLRRGGPGHLGFGAGMHACLGAALARSEIEACITALAASRHRLTLDESSLRWRDHLMLRGPAGLQISATR